MKLLTLARDLRRRRARERQQLFVAEGVRAVEELLGAPEIQIRGVLAAESIDESERGRVVLALASDRGTPVERVADREFGSAAETESPQGILAIAAVPAWDFAGVTAAAEGGAPLVILDAVQDPGNVGTIVRTATALGAAAVVAMPGTVDLWNAKVVRSSMGAHFHHPAFHASWDELDQFRRPLSLALWTADAGGAPIESLTRPVRVGLVVGNEGAGVSSEARERTDQLVGLAMAGRVESLNVAVATGILLYRLRA